MAYKEYILEEIGQVKIYKNRKNKTLKISLSHDGSVRLSMPIWVTFKMGLLFINKNKDWILKNKRNENKKIVDQQKIGKEHRIVFINKDSDNIRAAINENYITISYPYKKQFTDSDVQASAVNAAKRALKIESEKLVVARAHDLAKTNEFVVNNIQVKQLKGRWGSCNQLKELTFNIYLIQLPWKLIDYVIYHELVHTIHMNHGDAFWSELSKYVDSPKKLRKEMKVFAPTIMHID